MDTGGARTKLWMSGLGSAGVAFSHLIAYRLGHTDPVERLHVLNDTGHNYLPGFVTVSMFLAVLGLVFFAARRFFSSSDSKVPLMETAIALFAIQAIGFFGLELAERFLSGNGISLAGSPVLIALAVQLVLALGGALVAKLLAKVVDVVRKRLASPKHRHASSTFSSRAVLIPARPLLSGGRGLRGPPSS